MTIDSHVHFWKYDKKRDVWMKDMKILHQDYLPTTLAGTFKRNEVDGCVAVQADQSELETHFLVELSKTNSIIKGVVGWVDLRADNVEARLEYFSEFKIIKGYRHVVQGEPNVFLYSENFRRGVRALQVYQYTYDVLIYHYQLKAVIDFVSSFPDQKFVLDHCAKPDVRNKKIDEWKTLISELATQPNVYCKLSGLFTEADWKEWSAGDFYPYMDTVFKSFGTDRLMFGSDWPVMLAAGIYVQWKSLLEKYMEHFPEEDKQKVFGLNASAFYNL
jgi:L-fuconolactonase